MKRFFTTVLLSLCLAFSGFAKDPERPTSYAYNRGLEAYEENQFQDAIDWFTKELSDNPDNGYAMIYIGLIKFLNNENGEALNYFNNSLKKLPKKEKQFRSYALESKALVYEAMQDTIQALQNLDAAIKLVPEENSFYKHRGQLYYEMGKYDLSDADYKKMIELSPGDVVGYMGVGRNAASQDRIKEAIDNYSYVIKLAPDYDLAYSWRADAYLKDYNLTDAANDLITSLELTTNNEAFSLLKYFPEEGTPILKAKLKVKMTKEPTNNTWPFYYGVIEQRLQNYEEAIPYFERAAIVDAHDLFFKHIAECYEALGQYDKALQNIDKALSMFPDDDDYIYMKGNILASLGDYDGAIQEKTKYLNLNPDYAWGYLSRGNNYLNNQQYSEALEDYDMALMLLPWLSEFQSVRLDRGDIYKAMGKNDHAREEYNAILEIESEGSPSVYSHSLLAYSELGMEKEAEELLQKIKDSEYDDDGSYEMLLARYYSRLGDEDKALEWFMKSNEKGYASPARLFDNYELISIRKKAMDEMTTVVIVDADADENIPHGLTEYVEVPFTKENGVTKVKCSINGLPLHFVFDTGASSVTLSMVEANFMLKNDYIKPEDIIGSAHYMDANGDITEGTVINLRNVNIGGIDLENVRASVIRNQKAPLLLGQSVLGRLGKIEIDNNKQLLKISHFLD